MCGFTHSYSKVDSEPFGEQKSGQVLTSVWCVPGRGFLFLHKSPGTPSNVFVNVFLALQDQFGTGVGYIDAD